MGAYSKASFWFNYFFNAKDNVPVVLTFAEKVFFADKSFGGGIRIGDKDVRTIIQAMQKLESAGFKNIIYVAGSDRVDSFKNY